VVIQNLNYTIILRVLGLILNESLCHIYLFLVRNLHLPFIEVTSLGACSCGIPLQGNGSSSVSVDGEPLVLAYHYGELVFPGDL
jgi:hypothetical protein